MSDGMRFIEMLAAADIGTLPPGFNDGWFAMLTILVLVLVLFPVACFWRQLAGFFLNAAEEFAPRSPAPAAAAIRGPLFPPDPKPAGAEQLRATVPGGPLSLRPAAAAPGAAPAPEKRTAPQPAASKNNGKPVKAKPPVPEKRAKKPPEPIQPEPEYIPEEPLEHAGVFAMALAELNLEIEQLYLKNMLPQPQKYEVRAKGINVFFLQAVQQVSQHIYTEAFNMLTELLRVVRIQAQPNRGIYICGPRGHQPPPPGPWQEMQDTLFRLGCRTLGHKIHCQRAEAAFGLNFKDCAIKEWNVAEMMEEQENILAEMVMHYRREE
jgi:hypothetical protein